MDQPAPPLRYWACNRDAPRCGGGDLGDTKGLNAARPDDLPADLSHGRLETGPGGGPVSRRQEKISLQGRIEPPTPSILRLRLPAAWAAETDGKRKVQGAADGPPLFFAVAREA